MPAPIHQPRQPDETVTPEEMIAIREHLRQRLVHDIHNFKILASLHRRAGNITEAKLDDAKVIEIRTMLAALEQEDEQIRVSVRIREDCS